MCNAFLIRRIASDCRLLRNAPRLLALQAPPYNWHPPLPQAIVDRHAIAVLTGKHRMDVALVRTPGPLSPTLHRAPACDSCFGCYSGEGDGVGFRRRQLVMDPDAPDTSVMYVEHERA